MIYKVLKISKVQVYLTAVVAIAVTSCRNSTVDPRLKAFSDYLHSTFQRKLPDDIHYWFLVPSSGCMGCSAFTADEYHSLPSRVQLSHVTLLIATPTTIRVDSVLVSRSVFLDGTGGLDRLAVCAAGASVMITKGNRIMDLFYVENNERRVQEISHQLTQSQ